MRLLLIIYRRYGGQLPHSKKMTILQISVDNSRLMLYNSNRYFCKYI